MKLTVVGCSGSMPGPESPASCYVVESGGTTLLLDLGSGALGPLQRVVDLASIDGILLSHLHPDHCADLSGLYVARSYGPWRSETPTPVWGPVGTADRVARAYSVDGVRDLSGVFDFRRYPAEPFQVGAITVTAAPVAHRGSNDPDWMEAFAIRLDATDRSIVYSGDSGVCDSLIDLARGADVLLCEASNGADEESPPNLHMNGCDAGEVASAAGVGRLVLTHIPPWGDAVPAQRAAAAAFTGEVSLAQVGRVITLRS